MKPQTTATIASVTTSAVLPMDYKQAPFSVSFAVVVSGTLTYSVQHTFDDVFNSSVTPTWFDHSSIAAQTTNKDGNYAFPVRAVRLNVTAYTSGGATMTVLQGSSQ